MQFRYLIFSYAILLFSDGIIFQWLAEGRNLSILQPALFGGITFLMGLVTLNKDLQAFGKHGATALSVIAFASSVSFLAELIENFSKNFNYQNISNSVMAILSIGFLILAVAQFSRERKKKSL